MNNISFIGDIEDYLKTDYICKIETQDPKIESFIFYKSNSDDYKPAPVDSLQGCDREEWLFKELEAFNSADNVIDTKLRDNPLTETNDEEIAENKITNEEKSVQELSKTTNGDDEKENIAKNLIFEDSETSKADMFVCEHCQRVFANQYKLESHIFRVHKITKHEQQDEKNEPEAEWPPNVQELARRVNGVKTFFCNLCSYRVTRCDSMNKHMLRIHSNGRVMPQFQCEVCGKTFIDKAYLRNHKVSHATESKYRCEQCGRTFHRQPSLKRHLQSHSTEKQFACKLCDYKSNRKHLMYNHVEHHRKGRAYTCQYCGNHFFTQFSYRSHLYTHNVTPNSCSICRVGFSSKERWVCHMKNLHFGCEVTNLEVLENLEL